MSSSVDPFAPSPRPAEPGVPFAACHVFFNPGDAADTAYLIQSGRVEIIGGNGGVPIAILGPGSVFGEMALIEERPHSATARAVTAGSVCRMSRAEFERDLLRDPARCRAYLQGLFERLRTQSARLAAPAAPAQQGPAFTLTIRPLTRKAAACLPDEGLPVDRFPFRIGRASEAREPEGFDLNDLWLLDEQPFNVSRNHLLIDIEDEGPMLRDRGSKLGTVVNEVPIGGRMMATAAPLVLGENVVVVGGGRSPYQFLIDVRKA
jgi:CRP-like cAMP-binding protein